MFEISAMREASFSWPQSATEQSSKTCLAAWHLGEAQSVEFERHGLAVSSLSLRHCHGIDEIVQMLTASEVALVVVDVGLSECWPEHEVDRILNIASASTDVVFICNGSETEGCAIEMRCRNARNAHVFMGNRITPYGLLEFCNIIAKSKTAKPKNKLL